MTIARHLLLFSVCTGIVVLTRIVFPRHYRDGLRKVAAHSATIRSEELEASWRNTTFTDLDSAGVEAAFLDKIQRPELKLSEHQRALLSTRLIQVLRYLKAPAFEDYLRLKTEGLHYSFYPSEVTSNLLPAESLRLMSSDPAQFQRQLGEMWHRVVTDDGKTLRPGLGGLSLPSISAAVSHTNTARSLLTGSVKKGFTVAAEFCDPGFQYVTDESPGCNPLVFELSFIARSKASNAAGPVHLSLLWIQKDENWALNRLILDRWLGFGTLF